MLLDRELIHDGHTIRLIVTSRVDGWEVREEEDATVRHRIHREDWHRVETEMMLFDVKAAALKRAGWIER